MMSDVIPVEPQGRGVCPFMKEQKEALNCHIFEWEKNTFVYDVSSNELLAVEPELATVLPLFGKRSESAIINNFKNEYLVSKIKTAYAIISSAQVEEGLFIARQLLLEPSDPRLAQPGVCDSRLGHLVLTLTERCNLRCRYCLHGADLDWVRDHGVKSMSFEVASRAVGYFLDRSGPDKAPGSQSVP